MLIVELEDTQVWGSKRLYAVETWGVGTLQRERERLADRVLDVFHQKLKGAEIEAAWNPGGPELEVRQAEMPDMAVVEGLLEEAYAEVAVEPRVERVKWKRAEG